MKRRFWTLVLLAAPTLGLSFAAHAQQELLWKADNTVSTTLAPAYGGWAVPFIVQPKMGTVDDEAEKERQLEAMRAAAKAAAEAEAKAKMERAAQKKAVELAAQPGALAPALQETELKAVLQGPLGNSILWNKTWIKQGGSLQVPATISEDMHKTYASFTRSDPFAATMLMEELHRRQQAQGVISVTLVGVTSATAIFTDGREKYSVKVRQEAF